MSRRGCLDLAGASRAFGLSEDVLVSWLLGRRFIYRRTGIGTGRPLAYLRWVRAGFFENRSRGLLITPAGLRVIASDLFCDPASPCFR